jgi:uncharacterized membrane protein HdeD (DUF308 family)
VQLTTSTGDLRQSSSGSLKSYYFLRFAVAAAWVGLAFSLAARAAPVAAALLVAYPAWDAVANLFDARRNGGFARNPPQMLNVVVSAVTAVAVAIALAKGMSAVVTVFGAWAVLAGALQLATGVRRWKAYGAQWTMILSGAQSALAGAFFIKMASAAAGLGITTVAPYAAFGAFYFLVAAIWLMVSEARRKPVRAEI